MRTFILILLSCLAVQHPKCQPAVIDSLNGVLHKTSNDTLRLILFSRLGDAHLEVNIDSAVFYSQQYLRLSQDLNYKLNEADALQQMAEYMIEQASSGNALELAFKALQLLEDSRVKGNILPPLYLDMLHISEPLYSYPQYRLYIVGKVNNIIGEIYLMNHDSKGLPYAQKALEIGNSLHARDLLAVTYEVLSFNSRQPDSALMYLKKSYELAVQTGNKKRIPQLSGGIIQAYHELGDHVSEIHLLRATYKFCVLEKRLLRVGYGLLVFSNYYYTERKATDSALFFAMKSLQVAREVHSPYLEFYSSQELSELYKAEGKKDSAFKYLEMTVALREKTSGEEKIRQLQNADFVHQQQQAAIVATKKQFRNELKMYGLLAGLFAFVFLALMMWRNNNHRQKAFGLLQKQKERTEQALHELKSAQVQLIQSEKMASLGELTAGIAHEIQNPLNFVNNFSEVNKEMIVEMKEEIDKGNYNEVKMIANDIEENEEKISHHGKRADAIVKGMLQHSRVSSGQKEATDINTLADEYLRLAYHGLRAKDKSFNAKFVTDFDPSIGKINVVPQDIGRVVLNLINNAFYAVNEKAKAPNPQRGV